MNETYLGLNDLQISHLDSTGCEIRNLELDVDRTLSLASLGTSHAPSKPTSHTSSAFVIALDRWQAKLGAHQKLLAAAKLLDFPDNSRLLWRVVHRSNVCSETGRIRVFWHWHQNLYVVGCASALKLGSCLDGQIALEKAIPIL
jgi:hypothetical protein